MIENIDPSTRNYVKMEKDFRELKMALELISKTIDNAGIYPAAFIGKYEKRTDYMEGWNDAVSSVSRPIDLILESVESLLELDD